MRSYYGLQLQGGLLGFHRLNALGIFLEDLDGAGDGADLVGAMERGDLDTSSRPTASRAITSVIPVIGLNDAETDAEQTAANHQEHQTPEMLHSTIVKVVTRWVAAASVAALLSLVFVTISSIRARCAR